MHRNLGLNLVGIWGIYSCCPALFCMFKQRSNLDGGTRPPYNLSTACNPNVNTNPNSKSNPNPNDNLKNKE